MRPRHQREDHPLGGQVAQGLREIQEGPEVQSGQAALRGHRQGGGRDHPQHQRPGECGGGRGAVHPGDVAQRQHERRPRPLLCGRHQCVAEPGGHRGGLARRGRRQRPGERDDHRYRDHHGRLREQGRPGGRGQRRYPGRAAAEEVRPDCGAALHAQSLDGPPGRDRAGGPEKLPALHPPPLGAVQGQGRREAGGAQRSGHRRPHRGGQDGDHGRGPGHGAADGPLLPEQERRAEDHQLLP